MKSLVVRTPVDQSPGHSNDVVAFDRSLIPKVELAADSTHQDSVSFAGSQYQKGQCPEKLGLGPAVHGHVVPSQKESAGSKRSVRFYPSRKKIFHS